MSLKIVAAPFLNTRPLVEGLADAAGVELALCSPAEGARRLAEGLCDVALLPIAAYARQGGLVAAPGVCIGARGAVGSVLLVSDAPVEELDTIALDASSRTSVVLLKLLLRARRSTPPRFEARPPGELPSLVEGRRGALIIGDAALQAIAARRFAHVYDLAGEWRGLTGAPFVFAVWAGRPEILDGEVANLLRRTLNRGLERLDDIAADAGRHGVDPARARRYLREELSFRLDDDLRAGADAFLRRAAAARLTPACRLQLAGEPAPPNDPRDGLAARLDAAAHGARLSAAELTAAFEHADLIALGAAADARRRALNPPHEVTYIIDRNINYTNVCTTACRFCAFFRNQGDDDAYVLSREILGKKIQETVDAGGIQILLQGGLNPALRIEWYEDLFRHLKSTYPIKLHALSPEEILHIARLESLPLETVLRRLHAAGLDSVPGGGAEILVERVRTKIAKLKCTGPEWLEVMRVAHRLGLRSTATMMFACGELPQERVEHLLQIRDLQDETGGFTAFICWPFQPGNTRLPGGDGSAHAYLRTLAIARLALDNVPHLQASWPTMGPAVGQAALHFGADDFGSVMFEENVVSSAGTVFSMDAGGIERHVAAAGFLPRRRDMRYAKLAEPAREAPKPCEGAP
ncbi:MAG TPA: cyclic dehypoxanthinyl futalosine synthase [Polyangia bacterium]|nr:cyclic dehypoxanthinyl futalosine synthase [Polyangia bacterium]